MMMPLLSQQQLSSTTSSSSPASVADRIAMSYHNSRKTWDLPQMPQTVKSQSIPISSGMHRTASEVQLCEDEALADYRDFVVFSRIVNGISRQQENNHNMYLRQENDRCLAHIVNTRNGNDTLQSLSHHIVQSAAFANDYFCGEDPTTTPSGAPPQPPPSLTPAQSRMGQTTTSMIHVALTPEQEDDDGIFTLEL